VLTSILLMLAVFYAGAVLASGRAWFSVWRGRARFSELRDLTGIADRALMLRSFGLTLADGVYQVKLADVLKHRRRSGIILTNLPVHLMFCAALLWGVFNAASPAAMGIAFAAIAHAGIVALAALSVLARGRLALPD
jgi:hypothetical protein